MKHFIRFTALVLSLFFYITAYSQTAYPNYVDGQVYLKIKNTHPIGKFTGRNVKLESVPQLRALATKYGITKVMRPFYTPESVDLSQTYRVYFNQYAKVDELMAELKKDATVDFAEKVPLMKIFATPTDLGTQSFSNGNWALFKINAQAAWDVTTGSANTKIAIVDNAVQTNHTDLTGNIWVNPGEIASNGIDDDNNGYVDDINGWDAGDDDNNPNPPNTSFDHGTHCSGIASSKTNNGTTGVASIGYNCKIIAVKATANSAGSESVSAGYDGVFYSYKAGADVISLSWGGNGSSNTEQTLFNTIRNAGIVVFAAAGNDNTNQVLYPAGYNNVISVASSGNNGSNDQKSSFSNYGSWIDITAPGASIRSTVPTNAYANLSGTSMACPLVAGLAGLIVSINPALTPAEVENCIRSTADNINSSNSNYVNQLGSGRINAFAAVQCAAATVTPYDASVTAILKPAGTSCTTVIPQIVLKNTGQQTLTSVVIGWKVDNNAVTNYTYNGSLASQASVTITMPSITVTAGAHTYTATSASTLNTSQADGIPTNNTQTASFTAVNPTGQSLPFTDNFESGSFATKSWSIVNPDNAITWSIVTTAGQQAGTKSAQLNFFDYDAVGQRDGLITPFLNLSGLSAANLTFEYGYKRFNNNGTPNPTDSLVVSVSTDCGGTYPFRIFVGGESGSGNFATAASSSTEFIPAAADDWCFGTGSGVTVCPSINLSQFLGQNIRVKFETYNNFGNNVFIDDVNITGTAAATPPDAQFTTSSTSVCAGQTITFTSTSTNNPTSLLWTFPGGTPATSTAANPTVTFATAGNYNVKLKATNGSGTDSLVTAVTIKALPTVTVTPNASTTICAGNSATLTGAGATTYSWSPSTGLSGTTSASVTANPTSTTTYTVTGTTNGCSATKTIAVNVTALPNVQVTAANTICAGSNTTLTATGGTTYTWSPGTGLSGTTGATVTASPTSTQTYIITGTTNGCSKTATTTVTVTQLPTITAQTSNSSVCSGTLVTLTGAGGTTYSWAGNGLNQSSGASVTANPTQTTTYTVTGTANGCSKTATTTVTVSGTAPTVQVSSDANGNQICAGSSTVLTAGGATTYVWSPNTGLSGTTGATVTANPTSTQTYTIVGTTGSCFNSSTITVTVTPIPTVQAGTSNTSICTGATATLTATGATNFQWSGTDGFNGTGASVSVTPTQNTTYTLLGNTNGCSNTATVTVNVSGTAPTVEAAASKATICEGDNTTITATGGQSYSWSPATGLNTTIGATVTASPTQTTTYTITGDDGNGCTNTYDIVITVNPSPAAPSISVSNGVLTSSPATYYQWYKDGVLIEAATNQSYTPTEEGSYTVAVSEVGGCSITSNAFPFTTAIAESSFNGKVAIYPNPAHTNAYVDVTLLTKANLTIRLFNSVGQIITQLNSAESLGGRYALPVSGLAGGVYFVQISTGTQYLVKKLVLTAE